MPELPEVENVRRTVWPSVEGKTILAARVWDPRLPRNLTPKQLEERLRGRVLQESRRRGKHLLFTVDGGEGFVLHLRMSGQFLYRPRRNEGGESPAGGTGLHPHARMVMELAEGSLELRDQRRFATIDWSSTEDFGDLPCLARLGPEPLEPDFSPGVLAACLRARRAPIKAALLDQTCVAGLGNIYADEALFRARLHPLRPAGSLKEPELERLQEAIVEVLREALDQGGTTFRNYLNGAGERGNFQGNLKVYRREGRPCLICGQPLSRLKVAGRSSCYCEGCQAP